MTSVQWIFSGGSVATATLLAAAVLRWGRSWPGHGWLVGVMAARAVASASAFRDYFPHGALSPTSPNIIAWHWGAHVETACLAWFLALAPLPSRGRRFARGVAWVATGSAIATIALYAWDHSIVISGTRGRHYDNWATVWTLGADGTRFLLSLTAATTCLLRARRVPDRAARGLALFVPFLPAVYFLPGTQGAAMVRAALGEPWPGHLRWADPVMGTFVVFVVVSIVVVLVLATLRIWPPVALAGLGFAIGIGPWGAAWTWHLTAPLLVIAFLYTGHRHGVLGLPPLPSRWRAAAAGLAAGWMYLYHAANVAQAAAGELPVVLAGTVLVSLGAAVVTFHLVTKRPFPRTATTRIVAPPGLRADGLRRLPAGYWFSSGFDLRLQRTVDLVLIPHETLAFRRVVRRLRRLLGSDLLDAADTPEGAWLVARPGAGLAKIGVPGTGAAGPPAGVGSGPEAQQ